VSHHQNKVLPEVALNKLKEGNQAFVAGEDRPLNIGKKRIAELSTGQAPHTCILSCSDSRLPPEHIYKQGLGEIFTIRNAGNIVGAKEIASAEYAVAHLGVSLVVVMGHTKCGAITAAINTPIGGGESKSLTQMIGVIHEHFGNELDTLVANKAHDPKLCAAAEKNVRAGIEKVLTQSEIIASAVKSGEVKLVPAMYDVETGGVEFLE